MNRKLRSAALLVAFVLTVLAGSIAPTDSALAAGGTPVSGIISTDTTWTAENGPYLVQDDVLVDVGATLTIGAGTQVILQNYSNILVRGHIAINGTEGNLASIRSSSNSRQGELQLESNSNTIQYCEFRNMTCGVSFKNKSSYNIIDHCVMMNTGVGVYGDYYTKNNQILHSNISENTYGVKIESSSTGYLIDGCTFYHYFYVGVYASTSCNNLIVKNSYFIGNKVTDSLESGVSLKYNSVGVQVLNNEFQLNAENISIWKYDFTTPTTGITISGNNFLDYELNAVRAGNSTTDIQAANNYWNALDPAVIETQIYDFYDNFDLSKVLYTPFLTEKATMDHPLLLWKVTFDSQGGSSVNAAYTIDRDTIAAPPPPGQTGYVFTGWYKEASCQSLWDFSTDIITQDTTLYAGWTVNTYTIAVSANNTDYGSVSGGGSFDYGTSVTVNATPKTGHRFVRWLDGSIAVSTSPSYTFTVTNARTLEAEFVPISYAVMLSTNNTSYGSVSGGGSFDYGTSVTVNATPETGYRFVRWLEGSTAVSTNASYSFIVTKVCTLKAEFAPISYDVAVNASNTAYGSVSGGGSFDYGTSVTVNATPKTGYRFVRWLEGSTAVSTNASYSFIVTKACTFKAEFAPISYAVAVSASNTAYGWVSGGGSFDYGTSVTVNATPKTGYRFVRWLEGNVAVSTAASYSFTVTKARSLKAEFAPISYAVTVSASNTAYGSVSGGGSFNYGTSITLKAAPRTGCQFMCWQEGNIVVSTSANYTFTVTRGRTLTAEFTRIDTPTAKATAVSYNSIKLTWSAVSGADGYEVWRSTGSGYTQVATVPGTISTSSTNSGLATGTIYYYKVRAYRTVGGTKVYGVYSSVVSAKPMLAATTGLKAKVATYNSIKLTWTATTGAGGYEVWRSTKEASGYALAATVAGNTSTNSGLATGTTYYYKVRAYRTVNGTKVYGSYSAVVSARPTLTATTGLKVTATTYNSVKLTWTATTGAGGYEVWRSTKAASGYTLAAAVAGTTSTNPGLATGTTYYYKVRAYRTVNGVKVYGAYSSVVSAKPSLTTPTGVKAARASASSIKVSWAAVAGAMRYEVWRATSNGGTYYKLPDTTTPSYTNTGLTTGKTYYYKVRAYRTVNGVKVYGGYSAVVYAKP